MKFATITDGTGYKHTLGNHGSMTFLGVRCPNCSHDFMPPVATQCECPRCEFKDFADVAHSGSKDQPNGGK